jgi:hypothetical protein
VQLPNAFAFVATIRKIGKPVKVGSILQFERVFEVLRGRYGPEEETTFYRHGGDPAFSLDRAEELQSAALMASVYAHVEERRAAGKSSHASNRGSYHGPSEMASALKLPDAYVRGAINALIKVEVYENKLVDRKKTSKDRNAADGLVPHDNPQWRPRVSRELDYTTAHMKARLAWYGKRSVEEIFTAYAGQVSAEDPDEINY